MIYARRSIQSFIDALKPKLPKAALIKLVDNLNRNDRACLDFEWEVVVLFALSQIGKISYETNYGGNCHPDVTFSLANRNEIDFVAEITSVSDRGLEEENPTQLFFELLHKKAKILGVKGTFGFDIEALPTDKDVKNHKVKLAMPSSKQLPDFLETHITPKLKAIKANGIKEDVISITQNSYNIQIIYKRDTTEAFSGYVYYRGARSLTRNPIYTSLKAKAAQLRQSNFEGCKGIILCDGNCELLTSTSSSFQNYSAQQIIESFLRNNSSISFVSTLCVVTTNPFTSGGDKKLKLQMKLFLNQNAKFKLPSNARNALNCIPTFLPDAVLGPAVAAQRIREGRYEGESFYGGNTMGIGNESGMIQISARALLELLAGKIEPTQFAKDHGFKNTASENGNKNPFQIVLENGLSIKNLVVDKRTDQDDDWITFNLEGPDAAFSPFRSDK